MAPLVATLCSCPPLTVLPLCRFLSGSGIGTGPGVIQDRYSPTMGRHRTNPLFNGHGAHIAPPPQSQFDIGPKSFVKSNQVSSAHIPASVSWFPTVTPDSRVLFCFLPSRQVQNQHFLSQNQSHLAQQQVQSKDLPPRFSKKGQLNADEVTLHCCSVCEMVPLTSCPLIKKTDALF